MSPAKFLALFVVFHLNSAVSTAEDAAVGTPISCSPPPYQALPILPPPPPVAEPEPLPVPVAPANCPPVVVQCCQFLPPPLPPPPPANSNIYTPLFNESPSILNGVLVSVLAPLFGLATIF